MTMKVEDHHLVIDLGADGSMAIRRGGRTVATIHPRDWIIECVARVETHRFIAWTQFRERGRRRLRVTHGVRLGNETIHLLDEHERVLATVRVSRDQFGRWTITARARNPEVNRLGTVWWGPANEVLYGFGEYGNGPRRPPGRWSTWAEEGPVGLGPYSRYLRWTGRVPLPHGHNSTYAPIPTWLSTELYAGWIEDYHRIDWALRGSRRAFRVWSGQWQLHVIGGRDLPDVLARRARIWGPTPPVPAWAFFPWLDAVRGADEVKRIVRLARQMGIPSTAIWVEDWMGSWENRRRFWMRPLSHRVDSRLYPNLKELSADLHQHGFKFLGYFCPEIAAGTDRYTEALAEGHLIRDDQARPVDVVILGHHHGEPDLTRPATREWIKNTWFAPLQALGFDGWMADFGEYLPIESQLADGSTGYDTHNRYPLLWQTLHREFWEQAAPNDSVFFVRSASLGSSTVAPVMWGGDSDTDWDAADGLASVVPAALSSGLIGHPVWGTDIAGYMTFGLTRPSSKELYMRWTELASLLPIMRTHHGTARPRNWHWWRDRDTQEHFARYARLHALLFPYFWTLAQDSRRTGMPMVRPVFLHYPLAEFRFLNSAFLLGPDLYCAPVVRPKKTSALVQLPPGIWLHWWSGQRYRGPQVVRIPAPPGQLPLFVRDSAALPLLEGGIDESLRTPGYLVSLAEAEQLTQAENHLTLLLLGDGPQTFAYQLLKGRLSSVRAPHMPSSLGSRPVAAPYDTEHAPLLQAEGIYLSLTPGISVAAAGRIWTYSGPHPLALIIRHIKDQPVS